MGGSLLWWLGLSELIATIRHKLTEGRLKLINRIAGAVLVAFGLLLLLDGFVLINLSVTRRKPGPGAASSELRFRLGPE